MKFRNSLLDFACLVFSQHVNYYFNYKLQRIHISKLDFGQPLVLDNQLLLNGIILISKKFKYFFIIKTKYKYYKIFVNTYSTQSIQYRLMSSPKQQYLQNETLKDLDKENDRILWNVKTAFLKQVYTWTALFAFLTPC